MGRMNVVKPSDRVTLLLDQTYMPCGVITAKAAVYHCIKNHGRFLDANMVPHEPASLHKGNITWRPDQPAMRSAHQVWPIPTIFVAGWRFYYRSRKKLGDDNLPPLRDVYEFYRHVCCFCGEKIRHIRDASREHLIPKSRQGPDGYSNVVLAHRSCNSLAGNSVPKLDSEGNEITAKMRVYPSHFVLPHDVDMRGEWKDLLFQ